MYENLEILLVTVAGCLLNNRFDSRKSDVTAGTKSAKSTVQKATALVQAIITGSGLPPKCKMI